MRGRNWLFYGDPEDGETHIKELNHREDDFQAFYAQFKGKVIVGLEASGYSSWFVHMLEELGHEVWIGDATEIRRFTKRRQKNDRRDAELIFDLMIRGDFPRIHMRSSESTEILRQLKYRHRQIKMRTMTKNSLQSLAMSSGIALRSRLLTRCGSAN